MQSSPALAMDKAAASRARFKLLGSIMTTYGYAILAAAMIQPLLSDPVQEISVPRRWAILVALAFQAVAVYIAPRGEKP
jgi:hypothetical protein